MPLLLASLTLTGCCTTSGVSEPQVVYKTKIVDTACDWTAPIYVDARDVLTDDTARAVLAHNNAGAKICGWKPRGAH